jgi:N-glycosylase/DNA lyase
MVRLPWAAMLVRCTTADSLRICSVLETRWAELERAMDRAATLDDILTAHNAFLDTCLKECMLSRAQLIRVCALPA